ncbi:MAG: class I SAM-dependent methyltransferase, partial [Pseudodonghicola sp.]
MNIFWTPILRPLLAAARARRVIEIGADAGRNSQRLARWCRANGAFADIIDPLPGFDAAEFDRTWEGAAKVHLAPSLDILTSLPAADVVLIDGDHNWFTVYNEINLLLGPVDAPRPNPPILGFHDPSWPGARRDADYEISRHPESVRQPPGVGPDS